MFPHCGSMRDTTNIISYILLTRIKSYSFNKVASEDNFIVYYLTMSSLFSTHTSDSITYPIFCGIITTCIVYTAINVITLFKSSNPI